MSTKANDGSGILDRSPVDWILRPLRRYADFKGRAPRPEFWWFILFMACAQAGAQAADYVLAVPKLAGTYGIFRLLVGLVLLLPTLSVAVRRLHDRGRTGLWVAGVWFVTMVTNGIVVGSRMVGSASTMYTFAVIQSAVMVASLLYCALPGTQGDNQYGPDPYRPDLENVFA